MSWHVGTSGWSYKHWREVFYPPKLPAKDWLAYFTKRFKTAELNSSYYHWPAEKSFEGWREKLPPGFRLSVKAPRGLTHSKRLLEPEQWLNRIEQSLNLLGPRKGIVLVQLAPNFNCNLERLENFLDLKPRHLRTAFEFRNPSWNTEEVFKLLEKHRAAYCVMSGAQLPCILRATASFVYVRMHGPDNHNLYAGPYPDDDLKWWAARIREWDKERREVFVYFNNDGGGNAVRNAATLLHFLDQ